MSIVFRIFNNVDDVIFRRSSISNFVVNYTMITEIPENSFNGYNFFNSLNGTDILSSIFNERNPFISFLDSFIENYSDIDENCKKGVTKEIIQKTLGGYKRISKEDHELLIQKDKCVICQNDFEINDCYRKLPCCHSFHKKCIDPWFMKYSQECPVCRTDVFEPKK